jgi:hypothetical protein
MAIQIDPGQFCIVGSRYSESYRIVRADKVTAKQVRSRRWGNSFDVTPRDIVVFAGVEDTAKALCAKLNQLAEAFRKDRNAADTEYRAKCEPFRVARDEQIATFKADYAAACSALLAEQVPA